jgi:hypothetical protein
MPGDKLAESTREAEPLTAAAWLADVAARLGRLDGYTQDYAGAVFELRAECRAAWEDLREARHRRRTGRGRRPSLGQLATLRRRARGAWLDFDAALRRLEAMARTDDHPPTTPAEMLAALAKSGRSPVQSSAR